MAVSHAADAAQGHPRPYLPVQARTRARCKTQAASPRDRLPPGAGTDADDDAAPVLHGLPAEAPRPHVPRDGDPQVRRQSPMRRWLAGRLIRHATRVSTLTTYTQELLLERFPHAADKIFLTPGALRSDFAVVPTREARAKEQDRRPDRGPAASPQGPAGHAPGPPDAARRGAKPDRVLDRRGPQQGQLRGQAARSARLPTRRSPSASSATSRTRSSPRSTTARTSSP